MDDNEQREVLREISFKVAMPTEIAIGDPFYFEEEQMDVVYNRKFKGKKDWVGKITLLEEKCSFDIDGEDCKYTDINATILFAPTDKLLDLYSRGKIYENQKCKSLQIGVDTATYDFVTNHSFETIHTGADGYWGNVTEIYTSSRLDGIWIDIGFSDLMTFEEVEATLKRLFKVALTESNN